MFSAMPTATNETVVTCKWLVHEDAVEGVDYDVERLTHLWNVTNLQDRDLVENNQRGVNSRWATCPAPTATVNEAYVKRFSRLVQGRRLRATSTARTGYDPLPNRVVRDADDRLLPLAERDGAPMEPMPVSAALVAAPKRRRAPRCTIVPAEAG